MICKLLGHKNKIMAGGVRQFRHNIRVIYKCARKCKGYRKIEYVNY